MAQAGRHIGSRAAEL